MTASMSEARARASTGSGRLRIRLAPAMALLAVLAWSVGCVTTQSPEDTQRLEKAQAMRNVGIDHLSAGRTAMAIRKLTQAQGLDPRDPETRLWLGEAYRRKGMLDRAEENLLKALELSPDKSSREHQETLLNLSALYIQMKRYEDAKAQCQLLIDDPTFSTPWRALTNRGWAELQLGELDAARKSFGEALDFFPTYWPAHLNLGILEQKEGHPMAALRSFERALDDGKVGYDAAAEINYRMAEVYVSLGQKRKAIEHFSVALERSPYGQWGEQSKSYLELLR